jgi:ABC-type sugar transport system ATPase subunit
VIDIELDDLHKTYPGGTEALRGVTLQVPAGQCLALVGPSGCGKTTLLRVIAGLESPTRGTIRLGGRVVNEVPAHHRDVAMVFQRPALVLGQSVRANLAWSWKVRDLFGRAKWTAQRQHRLEEVARLLGIDGLLDRAAGELSGGQQQRVALGRALLRQAPVCLLDEPLGHLEAVLRAQLRRDLRLLSRRFPATMIHVTHDPAEALAVGDRVAVLHEGLVQQIGTPADVVRRPANRFVAAFCHAAGPLNFLDGQLHEEAGELWFVAAPWLRLAVPPAERSRLQGMSRVTLAVDGRDVKIRPADGMELPPAHIMTLNIALTEFAPPGTWVTCRRDEVQLIGLHTGDAAVTIGQNVMLAIALDNALWFETSTGVTLWAPTG